MALSILRILQRITKKPKIMLIKFGSIVTQGRGSLGGQVYSKNRTGAYVRNNAIPVNPQTKYQMESRAALAQFSQAWAGLGLEVQQGWNNAASEFPRKNVFGDKIILTGKNLYTSLNKELQLTGQSELTTAPTPETVTVPTEIIDASFGVGAGGLRSFTVQNTSVGEKLVVVATPVVSKGTFFVKNRFRVVFTMDAKAGTTEVLYGNSYIERFSLPLADQRLFVGVYAVNSVGQRTPRISAEVTTTA